MAITFNHNDKLYVSGSNVGIGTDSPTSILHLENAGNTWAKFINTSGTNQRLDVGTNSSSQHFVFGYGAYPVLFGSNGAERMRIDSSGNVGIGTTSPNVPLEIQGADIITTSTTTATSVLRLVRDITDASFPNRKNSAVDFMLSRQQTVNNNLPYTRLDIRLAGTTDSSTPSLDVMSLLHNGNVGIGKTDPSAPLHINGGSTNQVVKIQSNSAPYIRFKEGGTDVGFIQFGTDTYISNQKDGTLNFRTNNTDKMTILSNGNVGIGTTSPQTTLEVNGSIDSFVSHFGQGQNNGDGEWGGISIGYSETSNSLYRKIGIVGEAHADGAARQHLHFLVDTVSDANSATLSDSKMMIDGFNGNVGIGTTNPSEKLTVNGKILLENSGTPIFTIKDTGNSGGGGASGMIRFKNNSGDAIGIGYTSNDTSTSDLLISTNAASTYGGYLGLDAIAITDPSSIILDPKTSVIINGDAVIGEHRIIDLPSFNMGASSVTDEYLVVCKQAPSGGGVDASGIQGRISFSRGSDGSFNNSQYIDINIQMSLDSGSVNNLDVTQFELYRDSSNPFFSQLEEIDIDGTKYVALKARSSGGGSVNHFYFEGSISDASDTNILSRVRASDSTVTVTDPQPTGFPISPYITKNQDGDMGIGTTDPSANLEVAGAVKVTDSASGVTIGGVGHASLRLNRLSTSYDNNILFNTNGDTKFRIWQDGNADYLYIRDDDNATNMVTFKKGGNVGIGTTGPQTKLEVSGDTQVITIRTSYPSNSSQRGAFLWKDSANIVGAIDTRYDGTTVDMHFGSLYNSGYNSTSRLVIKGDGNVGIGTTSPSDKLEVKDGSIRVTTSNSFSNLISGRSAIPNAGGYNLGGLLFQAYSTGTTYTTGAAIYSYADGAAWTSTSVPSYLSFHTTASGATSTTERMVINSSGNVGIGTTSPGYKLSVNGDIHIPQNEYIYFDNTAHYIRRGASNVEIQGYNGLDLRTNGSSRLFIQQAGNVGIGTTSPTEKLHVAGNIKATGWIGRDSSNYITFDETNNYIDFYAGGNWVARLESDGDLHVKGDVIAFSDIFNP